MTMLTFLFRRGAALLLTLVLCHAAAWGDMRADSPIKFPDRGARLSKFPPDRPGKNRETPEKDYSIFGTPERSLEQIATIQAGMPKGRFTPPPPDWGPLARTRRILTEGGELRLMAIGDSIVNDTMRSGWVAKLAEAYPKAQIRGTVYVRGGGGCQHYKEEGRIAKNVVPRRPGLVFIGGISQQDIASIREVIDQLRAGLPQVEILLVTGAFGSADPRVAAEMAKSAQYGQDLRRLAAEKQCAFLDMRTPWAEYLNSTGLHPHVFYRDRVHANETGEQILSQILMAFFSNADCGMRNAEQNAAWAQWCGTPSKNMVSLEKGVPSDFYPGDKDPRGGLNLDTARGVRWAVHVGSYGCVSPTVAAGRVYIGSALNGKGILRCLDEKTGGQLWQWIAPPREVPKMWEGRKFQFFNFPKTLGLLSTPAVEDGRVYIVSHRMEVLCLDAAGDPGHPRPADPKTTDTAALKPEEADTSKVIWKYDMWDGVGARPSDVCNCSILIHGDYLYVCTSNGVDRDVTPATRDELRPVYAPQAPSLIVLEKKTGRLVAVDDVGIGAGGRLLHGQWSSPSLGEVDGRTLVFFGGGDGICYAFEALTEPPKDVLKLKPVWSFDCVPLEYQEEHKKINLTMIHHYCLGDRRRSDALNKKSDGTFVGMCEIIATPVFYQGRVYLAIGRDPDHGRGRGALWCIDPRGKGDITRSGKVWGYQGLDRTICTVSIAGGLLYIADVAGRLHCLDVATGEPLWVYETKAQVWGSTLAADGKVFLPTHKGLWVFAQGNEAKVLGTIDLGAPMLASPVAAGGTLYVASKANLWAVGK